MTKICIFGAGAIGGMMAACLVKAGADVSIVARGPHLEAIQANGMTLKMDGEETVHKLKASDDPAELGEQDYVIIALKAHSVPPIVDKFKPLLGDNTAIVSAVNGLPWWYFYKANTGTVMDDQPLYTVDPGAAQWNAFGPERAIGCVVYPACDVPEPGVIQHKYGNRFSLGEPDGSASERLETLSKAMIEGGLKAPRKARLRDELWIKLWGNCSFNPVSAITGASLDLIGANPACEDVVRRMMLECKAVGEAVGARFSVDVERRIEGGTEIVGHKPSTRQDVEKSRPMELDALTSCVLELARKLDIDTPTLDAVAALVRMQGSVLGLYEHKDEIEKIIFPWDKKAGAAA